MGKLVFSKNLNLLFFRLDFFFFFVKNFWFYFSKNSFFLNRFFFFKNIFNVFQFFFLFKKVKKKRNFNPFFLNFLKLKFSNRVLKLRKFLFNRLKKFYILFIKNLKFFSITDKAKIEKKKINHLKRKIGLVKFLGKISSFILKRLFIYKLKFITNFFVKTDPVFFSFFFNKFISKFMQRGSKFKSFFVLSLNLFSLKFFTGLRPLSVLFSSLESSRVVVGHIPKNLSGKIHIVPTFLYFDKQLKISIRLFINNLRKKQEYLSSSSLFLASSGKMKRFLKVSSFFLKSQKIYFSKFSKFTNRKNPIFDTLKKNYYLYVSNRSNLQYRWR